MKITTKHRCYITEAKKISVEFPDSSRFYDSLEIIEDFINLLTKYNLK